VYIIITNNNTVALVRQRTIPTERSQLVGEVYANFCRWVSRGQRGRNLDFLNRSIAYIEIKEHNIAHMPVRIYDRRRN
jgi:hypothetical protein